MSLLVVAPLTGIGHGQDAGALVAQLQGGRRVGGREGGRDELQRVGVRVLHS